jgi:hypothetical protein
MFPGPTIATVGFFAAEVLIISYLDLLLCKNCGDITEDVEISCDDIAGFG